MSSSFQKSFCAKTPFKQVDEGSKELDAMEAGASKNAVEPVVVEAPKNESEIKKADYINAKMAKMKKERQGRKAVKDVNKVITSIKNLNI